MSAFSDDNYNSAEYAKLRPTYPSSWYQFMDAYHTGGHDILVDVGCGPGETTFRLAETLPFKRIIGIDLSETMIAEAQSRNTSRNYDNLSMEFVVSSAEDWNFLKGKQADMITAAQCVHWLDWPKFQSAAAAALNPGGTLALWSYTDPSVAEYPELDPLIMEFIYGKDQLGAYWEEPGRTILQELLSPLEFDNAVFKDIVVKKTTVEDARTIVSPDQHPVPVEMNMTMREFSDHIATWSAFHIWKQADPTSSIASKTAFFQLMFAKTSLNWDSEIRVIWNSVGILARKR